MRNLLAIVLLFSSLVGFGQADLAVKGLVYGENGLPMKEVSVVLTKASDREMVEVVTRPNGQFQFDLSFDEEYTIYFNKPEYGQRYMEFDTRNVPEEEKGYSFEYGGFRVTLHESESGKKPKRIARIGFDPAVGNFTHVEE